jgi:hypothetical protein
LLPLQLSMELHQFLPLLLALVSRYLSGEE